MKCECLSKILDRDPTVPLVAWIKPFRVRVLFNPLSGMSPAKVVAVDYAREYSELSYNAVNILRVAWIRVIENRPVRDFARLTRIIQGNTFRLIVSMPTLIFCLMTNKRIGALQSAMLNSFCNSKNSCIVLHTALPGKLRYIKTAVAKSLTCYRNSHKCRRLTF